MGLALAFAGAAGCYPTVELGTDRGPDSNAGTTSMTGGPTTGSPTSSATDQSGAEGEGSGHNASAAATTTMPVGTGTGLPESTGAGSTSSTTSDTTGFVCTRLPGGPATCLECAQSQCCDEIEFCLGQSACACFFGCLQELDRPDTCQSRCDNASGVAAVMSCLSMTCGAQCEEP